MLNIKFGINYLLHRLKAKTRHGLHSPFVYRLVDEVIYDFSGKKVYGPIEASRKRLPNDNNAATDNAKDLRSSPKIDQLIYRIVADRQPQSIVALGEVSKITSSYLKQAQPDAKIYASESITALPTLIDNIHQLDLAYISGNYPKGIILNYFEKCLPKVNEGTLIIFDDIYRNEETKTAWAEIKANGKVTITVDLFWIGLVYFRKGKIKENFFIKF